MTFLYAAQPTGTDIVSLADMKEWLRVDHSDEDTTITAIIDSAVQSIQDYTGRHFKTTTFAATLDSFYNTEFPYQVDSVTAVAYSDTAGDSQTLDASKYFSDVLRKPGRIKFKDTPDLVEDKFNRVLVSGGVAHALSPLKKVVAEAVPVADKSVIPTASTAISAALTSPSFIPSDIILFSAINLPPVL